MSSRLVAFPSVTSGLAHLPNATSVSGVSIHYPLSPSGYSQEAEDKVSSQRFSESLEACLWGSFSHFGNVSV